MPNLPNSEEPILKDWLNTIFSNKKREFNSETILVGHSMGATLILKILEKLPSNIRINKAILVAGTVELGNKPELYVYKRDLVSRPFNWNKIKTSAKSFYFIHSDNDLYQCGKEQGQIMQSKLGGELIIKHNEGHFNLEKSKIYKQFPLVLEIIKDIY